MNTRMVKLIDPARTVVASAQVVEEGDHYGGTIDLQSTPAKLRTLFDQFEEIVNGQMFSFLDEIQEKIGTLAIHAVFDDGSEVCVQDLQVYPSTGDVSFRVAQGRLSKTSAVSSAEL